MNDKLYGELLLVALIFFTSARIFFIKKVKTDSFALLGPISLLIAVLLIVCWGITIPELLLLILSFFLALFNARALMRLTAGLLIDRYSVGFIIFSVIIMILSGLAGYGIFVFRQVPVNAEKFNVEESVYKYKKINSEAEPFVLAEKDTNTYVYVFNKKTEDVVNDEIKSDEEAAPLETKKTTPVLLFVPDMQSYVEDYRPLLIKLAARGYTIVAADYFTEDCAIFNDYKDLRFFRRAVIRKSALFDSEYMNLNEQKFSEIAEKSYESTKKLAELVLGKEISTYWLLSDSSSKGGMALYKEKNAQKHLEESEDEIPVDLSVLEGTLDISSVEGANASYGCVEQVDPWFGALIDKKRDHTLYSAEHWSKNIQLKLLSTFHD